MNRSRSGRAGRNLLQGASDAAGGRWWELRILDFTRCAPTVTANLVKTRIPVSSEPARICALPFGRATAEPSPWPRSQVRWNRRPAPGPGIRTSCASGPGRAPRLRCSSMDRRASRGPSNLSGRNRLHLHEAYRTPVGPGIYSVVRLHLY